MRVLIAVSSHDAKAIAAPQRSGSWSLSRCGACSATDSWLRIPLQLPQLVDRTQGTLCRMVVNDEGPAGRAPIFTGQGTSPIDASQGAAIALSGVRERACHIRLRSHAGWDRLATPRGYTTSRLFVRMSEIVAGEEPIEPLPSTAGPSQARTILPRYPTTVRVAFRVSTIVVQTLVEVILGRDPVLNGELTDVWMQFGNSRAP